MAVWKQLRFVQACKRSTKKNLFDRTREKERERERDFEQARKEAVSDRGRDVSGQLSESDLLPRWLPKAGLLAAKSGLHPAGGIDERHRWSGGSQV